MSEPQLRREVRMRVSGGGAVAGGGVVVAKASTPLWLHWILIAHDHAAEARARAGPHPNRPELHAAMVAVTASASAVDGLYGAVKQVLPVPKSNAPRQRQILELLKRGFHVGPKANTWLTELDWLFAEVRDPAVHHGEEFRETVAHPELELHVTVEHRNYSAASAERAVGIAFDIVHTCFQRPKPATAEWVKRQRPLLVALLGAEVERTAAPTAAHPTRSQV